MGILFAIIASIGIALGNVILKRSFKDFSPAISFFIFSVFGVLIWLPFAFTGNVQFNHLILGFAGGIASAILGQLIYIWVISKGELSITATILSTYSIFTIILSVLFNREHLQALGWVFVAFAIIGTVIVSLPDKFIKNEVKNTTFILYAIFAAICIGSSDAFSKSVIERTSIGTFYFAVSISQFLVGLLYLKISKEPLAQFKDIIVKFNDYKFSIIGSLFYLSQPYLCSTLSILHLHLLYLLWQEPFLSLQLY